MGRKAKNLIEEVADWNNLVAAHKLCRRGKSRNREVLEFESDLWASLGAIQNELLWGMYEIGDYRHFLVYDPKRREISAAPYRDRVVMQAICRVCEPIWTNALIPDTFACVRGRGVYQAISRLQGWMRYYRRRGETAYALHIDVAGFFRSIPHSVAKRVIRRRIACPLTLKVLDNIIESMHSGEPGIGIATGNLPSQWVGNLTLNEVDQAAKRKGQIAHYMRYMDDIIILSADKEQLRQWQRAIEMELHKLGLRAGKVNIREAEGVTYVGYLIWSFSACVKGQTRRRIRRRMRGLQSSLAKGHISKARARDTLQSWRAHLIKGECRGFWRKRVAEWELEAEKSEHKIRTTASGAARARESS